MATRIHDLTAWVHGRSPAQIAWIATGVIVAALILLGTPAMIRRVRLDGDRAAWRISMLITAALAALAVVVALDAGYRTHIGQTLASANASETAETLTGLNPIPTEKYYILEASLLRAHTIAGLVPEIRLDGTWTEPGDNPSFKAAVVGLSPNLLSSFKGSLRSSPGLKHMIDGWQHALLSLRTGHGYVTAGLARAYHIGAGDILATRAGGSPLYVAIDGTLPDGQLAGSKPAVIVSMADAQQRWDYGAHLSAVQVVYQSGGPGAGTSTQRFITSHSQNLNVGHVSHSTWAYVEHITVLVSGDFDRWLAIAAALVALLVAGSLWHLGRRPKRIRRRMARADKRYPIPPASSSMNREPVSVPLDQP